MKSSTKTIVAILIAVVAFFQQIKAQSVLNPADPVVTYNPSSPPAQPAWGQIGKWVRTVRLGWNTTQYKAYIYKGLAFRLIFPKSYNPTANDGKKYPMMLFFHGLGEAGQIYDNEYQLYHGAQGWMNAINNNKFDGYILAVQSQGGWGGNQYLYISEILEYMFANNKLDPFRITTNGLSAGGYASWDMASQYKTFVSGSVPMSGIAIAMMDQNYIDNLRAKPIWYIQGGLDGSPAPYTAWQVRDAMWARGANLKYTEYPDLGHGTWDRTWSEPDFYPFMLRVYSSNPWPISGRTEFCPGDPISVQLALTPGYTQYEWYKDGVLMPSATTNIITVNSIGSYTARVRRGTTWSELSPIPVVVKIKAATVTPDIQVSGVASKVLPALDGSTTVKMQVPTGFATYNWQKVGDPAVLSTTNTLTAGIGNYRVKVTEQFGCSSDFSSVFSVVNANGPNKPDAAIGLVVSTLSKTSLKLDWSNNPTPAFNETGFEIYQATIAGGPYKFIGITGPDVLTYTINGLNSGTKYFFRVRSVNNTGAAAPSNEANGTTAADTQAPTAPTGLAITSTTRTSIALSWTAGTDDVGVTKYEIYINGVKSYVTNNTSFVVSGLEKGKTYTFKVKGKDLAGNESPFSNQVSGQPLLNGLSYRYFTYTGSWPTMPDFNTLTPTSTGVTTNVSVAPRTQEDNYAFLWEGFINIPTSGNYYFRTNSDDGSKLWLGPLNGTSSPYSAAGAALVNNDGLHGGTTVTSQAVNLQAGVYPIAIAYYEEGGDASMAVTWRTPQTLGFYISIPNSAFADNPVNGGTAPAAPSSLVATAASFNQINLSWLDNSTNETGFEIYRSTSANSGYVTVGTAPANATTFADNTVTGSTTYYYRIRAIGEFGESATVSNASVTDANWKFNNNYTDASGNGKTLSASNSPTFNSGDKSEGTHALNLNGSNQHVDISTSSGDYIRGGFTQKTIAFWMKTSTPGTGTGRTILDLGGNDDGIAVNLNPNSLAVGIASGSNRQSLTRAYTSTGWNHIAIVYYGNTLKLFVNGAQVVANNSLPFSSVGTTSDASRIGVVNGTNALNTGTARFGGLIDNLAIYNQALSQDAITALYTNHTVGQSFATTSALPAAPAAPTTLVANGASTTQINVSWNDNAANETGYELYRSSNDNSNFLLLGTLPAGTNSYSDEGLFANQVYYYKVRAIGVGGNSAYSNEDSAASRNNLPAITAIPNQNMHFGTTLQVNVVATDADAEILSVNVSNLPAFAVFTPTGNGTGTITFNPGATQGTFNNITVQVTDQHLGTSTTSFNLVVNNNYSPVLNTVPAQVINENDNVNINLSATDQNAGDVLTFSVSGVPSAFTLTQGANGTATLNVQPGFAAAGSYNVQVTVNDGQGGFDTKSFVLTVNDKDPSSKIYVRINAGDAVGTPWNNVNGVTSSNFVNDAGAATTVGLSLQPGWWWAPFNGGTSTGNNTGVYPDNVMKDYLYFGIFGGPETIDGVVTGLNPAKRYNITFFAGSSWGGVSDNGTTRFTIGAQTVAINVQNNTQTTATIGNLTPTAGGTITFTASKAPGTPVGYLNAFVITEIFDDGTAPVTPLHLTAQNVAGQGVRLNWQDQAYNETSVDIYRSTDGINFGAPIGSANGSGVTTYLDNTVSGNVTYHYKVKAANSNGASDFSNAASVTTINRIPTINAISNISIKNTQSLVVNVVALDDATDNVTLKAENLPPFVTFTDNGGGNGVLNVQPTAGSIGAYTGIKITATDNSDSSRSTTFDIFVTEQNVSSVYVDLSDGNGLSAKPWNNMAGFPAAGVTMNNLLDDANQNTGISLTLVDGFTGSISTGMQPGNGQNVYPQSVIRNSFYEQSTSARTIRVSGLSQTKRYNFVFFNSHDFGLNGTTNFTINGQTVTLNASYNINKTVQINGIQPNASGQVNITVQKGAGADYAYISSLVIQSYDPAVVPVVSPADLRMIKSNRSSITLQWQDRSNNETNFEVWRATDGGASYTLLATVGAGVTSYADNNLPQNKTYHYMVRAKNGATLSNYSNIATAYTYASIVDIAFSEHTIAPFPWNALAAPPQVGYVWNNFIDETGARTNLGMELVDPFAGSLSLGINTGNNSGVYPDNVLVDCYVAFPGQVGKVKLTGLNMAMTYDFTVFGSFNGSGNLNTFFRVNGKQSILNASLNKSGTVTIYGLRPDENGEIELSVGQFETASHGFISALVIQGYNPSANPATPAPAGRMAQEPILVINTLAPETTVDQTAAQKSQPQATESTELPKNIQVYPNPFKDALTLAVPSTEKAQMTVAVYDAAGKMVYQKQYATVAGMNIIRIDLAKSAAKAGVYFVKTTTSGKSGQTFKVVKE